jgi:hypothetical protein
VIKIRLDKTKQKQLKDLHCGILKEPLRVEEKLKGLLAKESTGTSKHTFYSKLQSNLPALLFGEPDVLYKLVDEIHPLYEIAFKEHGTEFKDDVKKIFDYDKFRDNRTGYYAYHLTGFLQVNVCPYCNRMSIITHEGESGNIRPDLDHWLLQSEFPYLAISLYNLIPSCGPCNGGFKKKTIFKKSDHIHPYAEGYEKEYTFKYNSVLAPGKIRAETDFTLSIKPENGIPVDIEHKGRNSIEVFDIEGVYNKQKNVALEVFHHYQDFNEEWIQYELKRKDKTTGNPVYRDRKHLIEHKFSLKTNVEDYGTREHAKLKMDIAKCLGLIVDSQPQTKEHWLRKYGVFLLVFILLTLGILCAVL